MTTKAKIIKILLFLFILRCVFSPSAYAEENTYDKILSESIENIDTSHISGFSFSETAESAADGTLDFSLKTTLEKLFDMFFKSMSENISNVVRIAALCVFAGIITGISSEQTAEISFLACLMIIAGISVKIFSSIMDTALSSADNLLIFMQSLLPVCTTLSVSGGTTSSAAFHPAMFISMQLSIYICTHYFLPLTLFTVILSVINSLTSRFHLVRLTEMCRLIVKWGMGIVMTVYMGMLGLQGVSGAFADGVAGKTIKYAIGNFIPMVGGVLAESAGAVMASVTLIKNALSLAGIIAVIYMCISPLMNIFVTSFCFRLAGSICEPICDKRISALLSDISAAISLVFSVLLMMCVMFILSIGMMMAFSSLPMMMR